MNGGASQYARVLADAMKPIPMVAETPRDTLDPYFIYAPDDEWDAEMTRLYGDEWENEL